MKRWIIKGIIIALVLFIGYLLYINRDDGVVTVISEIELVDSTRIYSINDIEIFPLLSDKDLKRIKKLSMAFICNCPPGTKGYDTFPPIVSQLINLEYLDFSWNEISDLTPIQHLQHLKTIILPKNQVANFEGFKNFTELKYIDIRGNQLSDLEGIEGLKNLQFLDLSWNNNLSDLKGIEKLTRLEGLAIGDNNFESFPMEILQLKNLKRLSMDDLYFRSLPDSFYTDLSIEILQMQYMDNFDYSANLPKFHKLKELRELYLYWDNISMLDIDFEKCENLEIFDYQYLKKSNIEDLVLYTEKRPQKRSSHSYINITDVLTRIAKAPKLKQLSLEHNNIQYLPKNLVLPESLEVLNLSRNNIKNLPILKTPKLRFLSLNYNNITYLPENIVLPNSLEELSLYSNNIKKLPVKITQYTNLKKVNLRSNPIDTIAIKKIEKVMVNTKFYYDK